MVQLPYFFVRVRIGHTEERELPGLLSSFTLYISSCPYKSDGEGQKARKTQLSLNIKDCCEGLKRSAFSRVLLKVSIY